LIQEALERSREPHWNAFNPISKRLAHRLGFAGCSRDSTDPVSPVGDSLDVVPRSMVGTWLLESGSMMQDFVAGLATFSVTADVTAVQIGDDGTGRVWLRDRLTGAKDCLRAFVLFDDTDRTLVFDFSAETVSDVVYNVALDRFTFVYPVVSEEASALRIADAEGRVAIVSSQAQLPDSVACASLAVAGRFDGLPAPQFFSDLVLYQGDLIFNGGSTGQIERFSPMTHTLGTPLGPTSSRIVQTAQGAFFWTHCGCGGSRDAFKRNLTTIFDTISSEDEMGGAITFRAMAYDALNDRLWLHGREFDDQFGRFYVMITNGEPDLIERQISFNRDVRALAFDGTDLWAVVTVASQVVVRIDPATGNVLESYEVPDEDVSWAGLEIAPDGMYMLGTDLSGGGVIVHLNSVITSVGERGVRLAGARGQ
jgi:hypothetical protein